MKEKTKENEEIIEKVLRERIEENKELFNKKELNLFNDNIKSIKKIYLLGLINGRQVYGNNLH